MSLAIVLGFTRCAGSPIGALEAFIRNLIASYSWPVTSCMINVFIFKVPCAEPARVTCPTGCTPGKKVKHGDGTCHWDAAPDGTKCGKNIQFERQVPGRPGLYETVFTCEECATGTSRLLGFDAMPPVTTTPDVAGVTPQPGKILDPKQPIAIKFKRTMNATSVVLSSDMAGESSPYKFSRSTDQFLFNDTLTLAPASTWKPGRRTMQVDVKDESGNPASVTASWFVPAPGQAAVPDFTTCTSGCDQRWLADYEKVFTASGGFPPYMWSVSGEAPQHHAELFAATGIFRGGPTNCFLCKYDFTVCVTDQAQSQTCHPIHWKSGE